jgi:CheY-like chemotaxis protein/HPt (histidine-containing phosphotransfer) domain-containing protein
VQSGKHHLLVVDDNETNRRVALAILEHLGFETSFAADGLEAVNKIQSGNFSMVLMDCHMPVMDGHEATQSIRTWERETGRKPLPIIAVSASAFQDDRDRCTQSGMNDFIPKPVTLNSVQDTIAKWLPNSTTTNSTGAAQQLAAPAPQAQSVNTEMPEHLFDMEQYNEMKTITGAQFVPLLEKFFVDAKLQIKGMRDAAQANDAESMRKCSHKLKGSSGSVGAKLLSKVCHRMEDRARTGNIDGASEAIDSIEICLDEVIVALKQNMAA